MNIPETHGIEVADKGIPKVRVYKDAEDKNVAAVVIFDGGDTKYYYDQAKTNEVPATDFLNLYEKGVIIKTTDGKRITPDGIDENGAFIFGDGGSSSGGADWNAEEGEPGYIDNRPFYENNHLLSEDTVEEEDWSGQILLTGQEAILDYINDYFTTHGSLVGAVLKLTSSTESYSLPYNVEEGVFLYFSPSMSIAVAPVPPDNATVMLGESEDIGLLPTGDLTLYSYEIKKIDEKFLPENNDPKILTLYAEGYHNTRTDLALYYDEDRQNPITSDNCAYAASENWDIVKVTNSLPPVHGWESAINWLFVSHGDDYTYEVAVAKAIKTNDSKEIRLYLFYDTTEQIMH